MGSSSSKEAGGSPRKSLKARKRGKAGSPNQEKHASADSNAPLTAHASGIASPRKSESDGNNNEGGIGSAQTRVIQDRSPRTKATIDCDYDRRSMTKASSTPSKGNNRATSIDDVEGHSDVTRPPLPPRLRHLSELIDPEELAMDAHIRSPSGNLLAPEQFLVHPNRPRSIRERQEEIRERVRASSNLAPGSKRSRTEPSQKEPQPEACEAVKRAQRRKCRVCGCFGSE